MKTGLSAKTRGKLRHFTALGGRVCGPRRSAVTPGPIPAPIEAGTAGIGNSQHVGSALTLWQVQHSAGTGVWRQPADCNCSKKGAVAAHRHNFGSPPTVRFAASATALPPSHRSSCNPWHLWLNLKPHLMQGSQCCNAALHHPPVLCCCRRPTQQQQPLALRERRQRQQQRWRGRC